MLTKYKERKVNENVLRMLVIIRYVIKGITFIVAPSTISNLNMVCSRDKQQRANNEKGPHSIRILGVDVSRVKQSANYDHNRTSDKHD